MVTKVVNQILWNLNKKDPAVLPKNIVYGLAGRLVKQKKKKDKDYKIKIHRFVDEFFDLTENMVFIQKCQKYFS